MLRETGYTLPTVRTFVTRTVMPFALDRFEVTVGRFRAFIAAYSRHTMPADSAGANPHAPGTGWQTAWNDDPNLVPSSQQMLRLSLTIDGWITDSTPDDLPVRGVNWYVAFAFCIWDGGRLPTEAEWAFAATGGENRVYPWSPRENDTSIKEGNACYSDGPTRPLPDAVGAHVAGRGKFGQDDLAGNVEEWVFDYYRNDLLDCGGTSDGGMTRECVDSRPASERVVRGGSYADDALSLANTVRNFVPPQNYNSFVGFRCARD